MNVYYIIPEENWHSALLHKILWMDASSNTIPSYFIYFLCFTLNIFGIIHLCIQTLLLHNWCTVAPLWMKQSHYSCISFYVSFPQFKKNERVFCTQKQSKEKKNRINLFIHLFLFWVGVSFCHYLIWLNSGTALYETARIESSFNVRRTYRSIMQYSWCKTNTDYCMA